MKAEIKQVEDNVIVVTLDGAKFAESPELEEILMEGMEIEFNQHKEVFEDSLSESCKAAMAMSKKDKEK